MDHEIILIILTVIHLIGHDFRNFLKLFFEVKKDIKKDARISPDTVVTVVNVNIKMIQKWKIKMYNQGQHAMDVGESCSMI